MASSKAKSNKNSKSAASTRQKKAGSSAKKQPQKRSLKQQPVVEERESILTNRLRNDLIGVLCIAIAIVLMIAACVNESAVLTHWVSVGLHNGFGVGAYLIPIFLAIFGACFFFRGRREMVMPRLALGLVLMFLAIISLVAVNSPHVVTNTDILFQPAYVTLCGGYVGNGIAFCLLKLVGKAIAIVILVAVLLGGLVLVGLSVSGFLEWAFGRGERQEEQGYVAPYSRARGQRSTGGGSRGMVPVQPQGTGGFVPAGATVMLDGNGKRAAKTKKFSKGKAAETQVLDGGAPGKTAVLDPDDELMQGRPKEQGRTPGKTRSLSGAADAFGAKDAAKPEGEERKVELLADSKRAETPEGAFTLPDPKILKRSSSKAHSRASEAELAILGQRLQDTLHEFNVDANVVGWVHGPTVTLFKVSLASGVRVNRITALSDDIALAFASPSVRIFSPIAGTSLVGIEIPNDARENVLLGDVLPPAGSKPLLMAIGKDVEGNPITADLAKMPHLLIGGTTGSGKSVAINSFIMSVLMRATPDEVRMILIDPKRVELSLYNDIPHLFVPVVTDPHKAASTLAWAVTEMERRLKLFEEVGVRNIAQYLQMREQRLAELAAMSEGSEEGAEESEEDWERMPRIMIVIDELADLMMVAGKEVETSISRIAQLARAAGIHMIVATQRPSTNVITGLIKANITNRIAFNVASGIDSRVILDSTGAEHLIGNGDLLLSTPQLGKPQRIQGCYVDESEINDVCKLLKKQGAPEYHEDIFTTSIPVLDANGGSYSSGGGGDDDALLWEAAEIVVTSQLGSTSALQRRLKVGYARAGRIMDMLEDKGIVGPANGSKPRDVYIDDVMELENIKAMAQNDML
ncbi:MAG: DNA translocase FtsK 4TM domain-containing protein [Coriobacteriales bacterium]